MSELVGLTLQVHMGALFFFLILMTINTLILSYSRNVRNYAKTMRILMPIGVMDLSVLVFTGIVLLGINGFSFTLNTGLMLLITLLLILVEAKRYKNLKRTNPEDEMSFYSYKKQTQRFFMIGYFVILAYLIGSAFAVPVS